MTLDTLLNKLRFNDDFLKHVVAWERMPRRPARHADMPPKLDERTMMMLRRRGVSPLYSHQVEAIEAVLDGHHVVIATGTASGKSLGYAVPLLEAALHNPHATSLYLAPTKALAQDQSVTLNNLAAELESHYPIEVNIYDGDTPKSARAGIRKKGGIVLSNPDMLHLGILPYHTRWARFFQKLQYVVLDEMHIYRGVFGSHMANVIRRLRRICQFYGSDPVFICASATISNPQELAASLLEDAVVLVDQDGSPQGERHVILYNPPLVDAASGMRRSYLLESRQLASRLLEEDVQTILFAATRLNTELLLGYLRDGYQKIGGNPAAVRGYRGGYLPLERRAIEEALRNGEVRGVVATNALELGVDIGSLGAAVLAGYPGTIASVWQQIGRAGRRTGTSLGILVTSAAPLDQYIATHPAYIFEKSPEQALLNPNNPIILLNHLRCAAYELPFLSGEPFGLLDDAEELLQELTEQGDLNFGNGTYRWISDAYPAGEFSLRSGTSDTVLVQWVSEGEPTVIGEVDRTTAPVMVYEGAVYTHEGRQFIINKLDWQAGVATATETNVEYYTQANAGTDVTLQEVYESEVFGDQVKAHGRVLVSTRAVSYRQVRHYTHETLGYGDIDLPTQAYETTAFWLSLTPDLALELEASGVLTPPNNYGPNWHEQRNKTRKRDQYRCTHCGKPEAPDHQHDVHHLTPFREFGYVPDFNQNYKEANRLDNLVTVCKACHRAIETAQRRQDGLTGLASMLKNLAAVHLMCSSGDLGVLAEQRSAYSKSPAITIYDRAAGGLGMSVRLYDLLERLLNDARDVLWSCPCDTGCPACVGPVGDVDQGTKVNAGLLLDALLGGAAASTQQDNDIPF